MFVDQIKFILQTYVLVIYNKVDFFCYLMSNYIIYCTSFLHKYYNRNENIWNDGFLFDFLQKKSVDFFIRKFVIYTGFIFSERLIFDNLIRVYIDNLIWTWHSNNFFEISSISEIINYILFIFTTACLFIFIYNLFLCF